MPPTQSRAQRQAEEVGAILDQLRAILDGGPTVKNRDAHYAAFRRTVVSVVRRDAEPNVIDGYKSRHGDTSGSGGNSELTAVERAAFRLYDGGQPTDELHMAASLIYVNAPKAYNHLVAILNQVRRVPAEPGAPTEAARMCSHCHELPGEMETTCNGALDAVFFLCERCIAYVERQGTARAGRHGARLPDKAWLEQQRTGKAPKRRVDPQGRPFAWRDGSTTGITPTPPTAA